MGGSCLISHILACYLFLRACVESNPIPIFLCAGCVLIVILLLEHRNGHLLYPAICHCCVLEIAGVEIIYVAILCQAPHIPLDQKGDNQMTSGGVLFTILFVHFVKKMHHWLNNTML